MSVSKNLPRDVFLHLLSIVSLVAVAVSFGTLLFQYVNVYFPDVVVDYGYYNRFGYFDQIRSALAALIVFLPVYVWVSRFIKKDISQNPEKRDLKIRKWLLYLTLFVAALVIITDLIVLIRSFLEGELTTRFVLKVFSVLFIAGSTFYYYLNELREARQVNEARMRVFSWAILLVLVAGGLFGFFVIGSPKTQRLIRLDERRVNDLSLIQSHIIQYWQNKERFPQNLDELKSDIFGTTIPRDPETGMAYEYSVVSNLQFRLCGVFNIESRALDPGSKFRRDPMPASVYPFSNETWEHGEGRVCFDRTIDPEIIKPLNKSLPR